MKNQKSQQHIDFLFDKVIEPLLEQFVHDRPTIPHLIHRFVGFLTEDSVWLDRWITQQDALDLLNAIENKAHTGKAMDWKKSLGASPTQAQKKRAKQPVTMRVHFCEEQDEDPVCGVLSPKRKTSFDEEVTCPKCREWMKTHEYGHDPEGSSVKQPVASKKKPNGMAMAKIRNRYRNNELNLVEACQCLARMGVPQDRIVTYMEKEPDYSAARPIHFLHDNPVPVTACGLDYLDSKPRPRITRNGLKVTCQECNHFIKKANQ